MTFQIAIFVLPVLILNIISVEDALPKPVRADFSSGADVSSVVDRFQPNEVRLAGPQTRASQQKFTSSCLSRMGVYVTY